MTLTTHAIAGVAAASLVPSHRVAAFFVAFASHLLIDAIPHWDYRLASFQYEGGDIMTADMPFGLAFLGDAVKAGFDLLLGFIFSFLVFGLIVRLPSALIMIGAAGGVLPDFLQFVYMKFRHEPLVSLQRFHMWVHAKRKLREMPVLGITLQALLVVVAVFVSLLFAS